MADQIMVIEGVNGFDNSLEARGIPDEVFNRVIAKLDRTLSSRTTKVRVLEREMNRMRLELDKLDRKDDDVNRARKARLYDEFVAAGKRHDVERKLRDIVKEKIDALRSKNIAEYKRLSSQERSLSLAHKRVRKAGSRIAGAIKSASKAIRARREFRIHKDEPQRAITAHNALVRERKNLAIRYRSLRSRLRRLVAMPPSQERSLAISKTQEALRIVKRGLALTKKPVIEQERFLEQRQFTQGGWSRSRATTASVGNLDTIEEVDDVDLSGYEITEVDVSAFGGFMKDLKDTGESFVEAKSEVDAFSNKIDVLTGKQKPAYKQKQQAVKGPEYTPAAFLKRFKKAIKGSKYANYQVANVIRNTFNSLATGKSPAGKPYTQKELNDLLLTAASTWKYPTSPSGAKGEEAKENILALLSKADKQFLLLTIEEWSAVGDIAKKTEVLKKAVAEREVPTPTEPVPSVPSEPVKAGMSTGVKIGIAAIALTAIGGAVTYIIKKRKKS